MRDLISHAVMLYRKLEGAPSIGLRIQYEARSPFEAQARQAGIVWIIEIPSSSNSPGRINTASSDGISACRIDFAFQLAPAQEEVGLIIEHLTREGFLVPGRELFIQPAVDIGVKRK